MQRFYFMPTNLEPIVGTDPQRYSKGPKYFNYRWRTDGLVDAKFSMMDYGRLQVCLVLADVTQAQHDLLVAQSDVASPPEDIDQLITEQALPQVQNVLEAMRIPAGWVDTTYTYRDIIRRVAGLFQFAQRHNGLHQEELIDSVAALDLTWAEIPLARRDRVAQTADSFGYDYSTVTGTWTVRQTLMHLANQWGATPIYIGGYPL